MKKDFIVLRVAIIKNFKSVTLSISFFAISITFLIKSSSNLGYNSYFSRGSLSFLKSLSPLQPAV